jgi:hypothetical protein
MTAQDDRVAVGAGVVGRPRGLRAGGFILRSGRVSEGRRRCSGKGAVAASRSGALGAGRGGVEAEAGWEGVGDRSRS